MQRIALVLVLILAQLALPTREAGAASPEPRGYIVVLDDRISSPAAAAAEIAREAGGRVGFVYQHALKGFSISVPPQAVAALERNPMVKYVATDDVRTVFAQTVPTGVQRIFADTNAAIGINGADDYRVDVDVAVIDTGIDLQHPDLNVRGGIDCTGGSIFRATCTAGGDDDHYHGTHVAGTIGALDNGYGVVGVAPGARLWAVKVLNSRGSGYSSWIIAGIDWVAANAATIEVANMSLGGTGYSQAEYDAIQGAVNRGVAFAVAAGNSDADARDYSPAAFDNVLTVSALADFNGQPGGGAAPTCRADQDDTLADFSNWGPAVDLAAPGVCILSTFPLEQGGYGTISGTSMASPHVAGALALLASVSKPAGAADVFGLYAQVRSAGNFSWIDDSGDGTKEPLLDVGTFGARLVPVAASNAPPVVTVTGPADGATFPAGALITFSGTAYDNEDGDLAGSLAWTSSLAGALGTGGTLTTTLGEGTHTITASVVDAGGLSGNDSVSITVSGGSGFALSVLTRKVKSLKYADLTWSGTAAASVDVWRNTTRIASSTPNTGSYTDGPLGKTVKSATYKVCEAGSASACSNAVTVIW